MRCGLQHAKTFLLNVNSLIVYVYKVSLGSFIVYENKIFLG